MIYINCTTATTTKLKLDRETLIPAPEPFSALGNWTLHYTDLGPRKIMLFMNELTFLNFIIFEGKNKFVTEAVPAVFEHGLTQMLGYFKVSEPIIEIFKEEATEIALGRTSDGSITAKLNAIAADYRYFVERSGGLSRCDITEIILKVNDRPCNFRNFRTPRELTLEAIRNV